MPLYRFHIETPLNVQAVIECIHGLVRDAPTFLSSIKEKLGSRPEDAPPFIGTIEGNEFNIRRDIRYRNSFLPNIKGEMKASPMGTRINIKMTLHPFTNIFMLVWLGAVGFGGFEATHDDTGLAILSLGMFIFGTALIFGGFYPEAFKARRILEQKFSGVQKLTPDKTNTPET